MGKKQIFKWLKQRTALGLAAFILVQGISLQSIHVTDTYANVWDATNATSHTSDATPSNATLSNAISAGGMRALDWNRGLVAGAELETIRNNILEQFGQAPYDVLIRASDEEHVDFDVDSLEEQAGYAQEELLEFLEEGVATGAVESYESYYIVNGIHAVIRSEEFFQELLHRTDVQYITPNFKVDAIVPINDGGFSGFRRSFSLAQADSYDWGISMIGADRVWNEYGVYGEGVVVGIIDTGVNYTLPQLRNSYRGYDATTGVYQSDSYLDLLSSLPEPRANYQNDHGTFVAGIISGGMDPRFQSTIGIAPGAKFINVRALDQQGTTADIIMQAAQWMLEKRPDVINCSWGYESGNNPWFQEIAQAWRDAGIVAVFASGNTESLTTIATEGSIMSPANLFNVLAVGAVDARGKLGSFSKRGPSEFDTTGRMIKPDLTAPGVNVYSVSANGYFFARSGTSYSAPFVTATIALMKSVKPDLTVEEIEDILKTTAKPLTDTTYPDSPNMGYGYGMVDAYAAVTKVREMAGLSEYGVPSDSENTDTNGGTNTNDSANTGNSSNTGNSTNTGNSSNTGNSANTGNPSDTGNTNANNSANGNSNTDSHNNTNGGADTNGNTNTHEPPSANTNADATNANEHGNTSSSANGKQDANAGMNGNPNANQNTNGTDTSVWNPPNSNATSGSDTLGNNNKEQISDASKAVSEHTKTTQGTRADTGSSARSSSSSKGGGGAGGGGGGFAGKRIGGNGSAKVAGSAGNAKSVDKSSNQPSNSAGFGSWKQDKHGWRYQKTDGSFVKTTWLFLEHHWYYMDENGYAVTGWKQVQGKWYYMNKDCAMATGWVMIHQTWYYLGADGAMFANTKTPDGYQVDANGAWIVSPLSNQR